MPRIANADAAPERAPSVPRPADIFDPVGRALEAIGDRWTLVLLNQLREAPRGFQELRVRTGIAPRVLSSRLRELTSRDFVRSAAAGARSVYELTEQGRSLEPIITAIGRWWIQRGVDALGIDARSFTETSAQSVIEALPFMVREDRATGVDLTFEIRLTGDAGGVWTVHVVGGSCHTRSGFAERADVRYTADSRTWCGVALGLLDAHEMFREHRMSKEGGREAMDFYFHQVSTPPQAPQSGARSEPQANEGGPPQAPQSGARSKPQANEGGPRQSKHRALRGARSEPKASEGGPLQDGRGPRKSKERNTQ